MKISKKKLVYTGLILLLLLIIGYIINWKGIIGTIQFYFSDNVLDGISPLLWRFSVGNLIGGFFSPSFLTLYLSIIHALIVLFAVVVSLYDIRNIKWKTEKDYHHDIRKTTYDQSKFERGENYINTEVITRKDMANKYNRSTNIGLSILFILSSIFCTPFALSIYVFLTMRKLPKIKKK